MKLVDLVEETFFSLASNKSRSSLTILGIVIGIASVITMISVGQGATKDIEANIQSLGSNMLIVMPGSQRAFGSTARVGIGSATTLTIEDAEAIRENIPSARYVSSQSSTRKQVSVKGGNTNTTVYGVESQYIGIRNIEMEFGSFITDMQTKSVSRVAVLGPVTRDALFGNGENPVGQKIRIDRMEFTVIGVTVRKGGSSFGSSDDLVYIPISTLRQYFTGTDSVNAINIGVESENQMSLAQSQVTDLLLFRHNIKDPSNPDFSIVNQADVISTVSSVTGTMTLLLGAIGGISLLVGGIGIMNMMLTTVTERTREIGLRKSLGAKDIDISMQFLSESVTLTLIGGIVGILVGLGGSFLVTKLSGTTTLVTPQSVFLAFGVAAAVGIIFGYYPAKRAAKLDPIEALRYE